MEMAKLVASRSTCLRRQVGCVLVNSKNQVLSTGYNGAPKGHQHCKSLPCVRMEKGLEYCVATHAEQNALLQCDDVDDIDTCYVTTSPCVTCVKMLLNTSCRRIIFLEEYNSQDLQSKTMWLSNDKPRAWVKYEGLRKIDIRNITMSQSKSIIDEFINCQLEYGDKKSFFRIHYKENYNQRITEEILKFKKEIEDELP